MTQNKTKSLTFIALMIVIVVVATFFGVISPLDASSLIHLGSFAAMTIALRYGKKIGALAGGLGMGIFDVIGGWFIWAPVTLVSRLIGGYLAGLIAYDPKTGEQGTSTKRNIVAILVGMAVMLPSYFVYRYFLYGAGAAVNGLFGDSMQWVLAMGALYLVIKLYEFEKATKEEE